MPKHPIHTTSAIRISAPVTPETLEAFKRLAKSSNTSLSRCVGAWLVDTMDAALFVAEATEKARSTPRTMAQQLHAFALCFTDQTGQLLKDAPPEDGDARGRDGPAPAGPGAVPGGDVPGSTAEVLAPSGPGTTGEKS